MSTRRKDEAESEYDHNDFTRRESDDEIDDSLDPEGPSADDLRELGDQNEEPDVVPCPLCGKGIIDGADWCPHCERAIIRPTHGRTWIILTALAILALIAYGIICLFQGNWPL